METNLLCAFEESLVFFTKIPKIHLVLLSKEEQCWIYLVHTMLVFRMYLAYAEKWHMI